jgi:hypothetical protein
VLALGLGLSTLWLRNRIHVRCAWSNITFFKGAACYGLNGSFPFNVATKEFGKVVTMSVDCVKLSKKIDTAEEL